MHKLVQFWGSAWTPTTATFWKRTTCELVLQFGFDILRCLFLGREAAALMSHIIIRIIAVDLKSEQRGQSNEAWGKCHPLKFSTYLLLHACKQLANILPSKSTQQNLSWLQFLTSRISSRISLHFRPTSNNTDLYSQYWHTKAKAGGPYFVKSLYLSLFVLSKNFCSIRFLSRKLDKRLGYWKTTMLLLL